MSRVRVPEGVLAPVIGAIWPVGQVVKTEASHAFNIGLNPVRVILIESLIAEKGGKERKV